MDNQEWSSVKNIEQQIDVVLWKLKYKLLDQVVRLTERNQVESKLAVAQGCGVLSSLTSRVLSVWYPREEALKKVEDQTLRN